MKKVNVLLFSIFSFCILTSNCFALEQNYTEEQILQGGGIENLILNEKKDKEKELKFSQSLKKLKNTRANLNRNVYNPLVNQSATGSAYEFLHDNDWMTGFFNEHPIFEQETGYYCGPASVKNTLNIINGDSLSQSTYASNMGTDGSGTYVYKISQELNKWQNVNSYGYREITGKDFNYLNDPILHDLTEVNVPIIVRANTKPLYMYNNHELIHYLTIVGYGCRNTDVCTYSYRYNDSYSTSYGRGGTFGEHIDTATNFYNASTWIIW